MIDRLNVQGPDTDTRDQDGREEPTMLQLAAAKSNRRQELNEVFELFYAMPSATNYIALQRAMLNYQEAWGEWDAAREKEREKEKLAAMAPSKAFYSYCPCCGCSDQMGYKNEWLLSCNCGALFGDAPNRRAILEIVCLGAMSNGSMEKARYFDFRYRDIRLDHGMNRTHGWFDPVTKKVLQFG